MFGLRTELERLKAENQKLKEDYKILSEHYEQTLRELHATRRLLAVKMGRIDEDSSFLNDPRPSRRSAHSRR